MLCPKCKKEIPEGSSFCCFCGKKLVQEKRKALKRANGMGSAYKVSGRRRKPWAAVKNKVLIGYFETKTDALEALEKLSKKNPPANYNSSIDSVFEKWAAEHLGGLTSHGKDSYNNSWKHCAPIYGMKMRDLRTADYQSVIDAMVEAGKKRATCVKVKSLMTQLNKWAIREDVVEKDYSEFVVLPKYDSKEKKIFTDEQIKLLFENASDQTVRVILILIYTGLRIGELMTVPKADVHLDDSYMIAGEKSEAGRNRIVPISDKVHPFVSELYSQAPDGGRLIEGYTGSKEPNNFRNRCFNPTMEKLGIVGLTPHSTRHTCASLMVAAGIPREQIQRILGHAQYSTTADYYVHANIDQLVQSMKNL
jgi:integrase